MIRVKYTPTYADWRQVNLHVITRQVRLLLVPAAFLLLCFVLLPWVQLDPHRPKMTLWATYSSGLGLLILPGLLAFLFISIFRGARRAWQSDPSLREERELLFDATGLGVSASTFSSHVEWQHLTTADLARGLVLLKAARNTYYYFPVSAAADWPALRDLISAHMKAASRFRRHGGL